MSLPSYITVLSKIEFEQNVVSIFSYKDTSSWISIKNLLTDSMYDQNVRIGTNSKKSLLTLKGLFVFLKSIKNYLFYLFSHQSKNIYLGASTGIFKYKEDTLDAYFPYYDMQPTDSIYMTNCGNLDEILNHKEFYSQNKIVVENYLVVPFKKLLAQLLRYFISKKQKSSIKLFAEYLFLKDINVSYQQLIKRHAEFIAGYELYKLFFRFLKIDKAYIVSAPTKSDILASLKALGVRTIEMQHGIVGKLHRGYNYNFLPNDKLPTPNEIHVYNQFWKDEIINASYFKESQIKIVGRLKYDIAKDNLENLNFKYIIFTGQGAFFDKIIEFFIDADEYLISKNMKLFYKPHPRETKKEIKDINHKLKHLKSCSIYDGIYTTEELIKNSLAHISIFSSCHFDAVYYKDKTYIFDVMDENIMLYYGKLYSNKFVKIKNISEVIDA